MIEDAYTLGKGLGLEVWCCDQAGPFQTVPQPGPSWQPEGPPAKQPHEYIRDGTAKILTLFRPADGRVRVEGATACPNEVLHPWLKRELSDVLAGMPDPPPTARASREAWQRWQRGLSVKPTLAAELPPLRMLLVLDDLAGRKTPEFVLWLFAHGIMPVPEYRNRPSAAHEYAAGLRVIGDSRRTPSVLYIPLWRADLP